MSETPREVIVVIDSHTVDFSRYPWLRTVKVHAKGGDAGTEWTPGEPGYLVMELFD